MGDMKGCWHIMHYTIQNYAAGVFPYSELLVMCVNLSPLGPRKWRASSCPEFFSSTSSLTCWHLLLA